MEVAHSWGWGRARECVEMLQKPGLEKPSTALRVGEFRFFMPVGPEELSLQALSSEQRGYRVFYTWTGMIKWVCGFAGAG